MCAASSVISAVSIQAAPAMLSRLARWSAYEVPHAYSRSPASSSVSIAVTASDDTSVVASGVATHDSEVDPFFPACDTSYSAMYFCGTHTALRVALP